MEMMRTAMVRDFAVWFALALVYTVLKYTETGEGEEKGRGGKIYLSWPL
jgi:hypothetical protein